MQAGFEAIHVFVPFVLREPWPGVWTSSHTRDRADGSGWLLRLWEECDGQTVIRWPGRCVQVGMGGRAHTSAPGGN